jgi:hypothetical protein
MTQPDMHFVWTFLIIMAILNFLVSGANIWTSHRRVAMNNQRDRSSLRAAFKSELQALSSAAKTNQRLIRDGRDHLISLRSSAAVYKPSINRLSLLTDDEIALIVDVYARIEQIEALLCATAKPHGALSYKVIKDETPLPEIRNQLVGVARSIAGTLAQIERAEVIKPPLAGWVESTQGARPGKDRRSASRCTGQITEFGFSRPKQSGAQGTSDRPSGHTASVNRAKTARNDRTWQRAGWRSRR